MELVTKYSIITDYRLFFLYSVYFFSEIATSRSSDAWKNVFIPIIATSSLSFFVYALECFFQQYIGNERKGNEIREESVQKIASMTWGHKKCSHLPVYEFETQFQSSFPTNPLKCSQTPFFKKKLLPHFSGSLNSTHLIAAIEKQQKKTNRCHLWKMSSFRLISFFVNGNEAQR